MESHEEVRKVRVLVIGDSEVVNRLINKFTCVGEERATTIATIGMDVQYKTVFVGDKPVRLHIWTTAGLEKFDSIPVKYYQGADGVILVYDVTRIITFDDVIKKLDDIVENASSRDVKIALVANKFDLVSKRTVMGDKGRSLATKRGILFFETNAQTGENVTGLFQTLACEILNKVHSPTGTQDLSVERGVSEVVLESRSSCRVVFRNRC